DATSAALCMQRGAMDYLTKPIELADLGRAVHRALKRREMLAENRHLNQWLKEEVTTRTAELQRERMRMERISTATLEALVNAMEAKDPYLRGHSARVADLSATLAAELGLSDDLVEQVRVAGRLHDLGKIGTRDDVVNKEGPLTPEEFDHVKQHVVIGSQILAPLAHLGDVISFVRHHHERWDGSGYPDGLSREAIPIGARVIGAAEVFDALTTSRPYQEKMTPEDASERMAALAGTVVDPKVHQALAPLEAGGPQMVAPAHHRLTRPRRDVVNVAEWDPRRSTILVFDAPQPMPVGPNTTSSFDTSRATPWPAGPGQDRRIAQLVSAH